MMPLPVLYNEARNRPLRLQRARAYLRARPWTVGALAALGVALAGLALGGCSHAPDPQNAADLRQVGESIAAGHAAGVRSPEQMIADVEALARLGVAVDRQAVKDAALRMVEAVWGRVLDWGASWAGAALAQRTGQTLTTITPGGAP